MAVKVIVVGDPVVKVNESGYDDVTVSIDVRAMDGLVEVGAKTLSTVISQYTEDLYGTALQRLNDDAAEFGKYCERSISTGAVFKNLAVDLQAKL